MRPWSTSESTPMGTEEVSTNGESPEAETKLDETTDGMPSWFQSFRKATTGPTTGTGLTDRSRDVERNLGY